MVMIVIVMTITMTVIELQWMVVTLGGFVSTTVNRLYFYFCSLHQVIYKR